MDNHQQHNDGGELSSRHNDYIAAELWRMQQAREEENNALMQLLSARQSGSMNGGSSSAFGNGMNGGGNGRDFDSGNNGGNNSSAISNYAAAMNNNHLDNLNPISISSMNNSGGLGGSSTTGMFNFMNSRAVTMTSGDKVNSNNNMSSAAGGSSSSEFNRNDNFDAQQMSNFIASQGYGMSSMNSSMPSNMNTEYDYLLQQQLLHGSTAGMQGSSIQGMNNLDIYLSSAAAAAQQAYPQEDPGWEEQFKSLRTYQMQFGNCKVPARFKANPKLGRWVMTQRRQFTLLMQGFPSALTADRIRRLESIGFTWTVRPEPVTTWNTKFQELKGKLSFMQYVCSHLVYTLSSSLCRVNVKLIYFLNLIIILIYTAYKATYGNCMVPQRYQANPQLGTWVHTQRRQYKLMQEGKKCSMTKEKAAALDSVGFFWAAKNVSASSLHGHVKTVADVMAMDGSLIEEHGDTERSNVQKSMAA